MEFQHVGIVGVTAVGASLCYQRMSVEAMKKYGAHPPITIHNYSNSEYITDKIEKTVDLLVDSIHKVKECGAEFAVIPANTVHYYFEKVLEKSPLPLLNIIDITVEECARRKLKKVSVLGTYTTMVFDIYKTPLTEIGIELVELSDQQKEKLDHLINTEFLLNDIQSETQAYLQTIIEELKAKGSEAILLACTELTIALNDGNSALPCIDSNSLLASKAVEHARYGSAAISQPVKSVSTSSEQQQDIQMDKTVMEFIPKQHIFPTSNLLLRSKLDEGKRFMDTSDFKQAQILFKEAVEIDPLHPEARGWLIFSYGRIIEHASVLNKVKLLPAFERETKAAIKMAPLWTLVRRVNGMRLLNTPEQFGGSLDKALEELMFCIKAGEEDADLYLAIFQVYQKKNDMEQASFYLNKAFSLDNKNPKVIKELELMGMGINT